MTLPNTLIIGAQKAGTSAVFNWLSQHPDVCGPEHMKDFPFFCEDSKYINGTNWFSKFFEENKKIVLHGHVNYLYFSKASAERIKLHLPNVKIICILRDPVTRAYSAYWQAVKMGYETLDRFEEAITLEKKKLKTDLVDEGHYKFLSENTYIDHGFYYSQLKQYYKTFKKENLLVLRFEDLKIDQEVFFNTILDFLELERRSVNFNRVNDSGIPKIKSLQRLVVRFSLPRWAKKFIPVKFRLQAIRFIKDRNVSKTAYPPLDATLRKELYNTYKADISKLEDLTGINFDIWREHGK
ncbi:sulfotransferase [Ekhidna sp.]|uniref:sulfotransferase family protein n=1 Tax=Ekhidna sp. TaxID=2608089 RepID=UPI0032EBE65D